MPKNKEFTEVINNIKNSYNLNRKEIAAKIGVNYQYLTNVINGYYPYNDELKRKIARAFAEDEALPAKSTTIGVPYYNVDFLLGFEALAEDQTRTPDYLIDFPPYNQCDCWVNAHGDSMHPTISGGDMVALTRIYDWSYLINGEIYAIVTSNGLRTIKRVQDHGGTLTLVADNPSVGSQEIPKDIVTYIYHVRGILKMF